MKYLKGNGVPTRKTIGAIGDIYIDENTGIQYKCTFAYRSENDAAFDCQWSALSATPVDEKIEEPVVKSVETIEEEKPTVTAVEDPVKEEKKPTVVEESVKEEKKSQQKRTDYTSYSKKTR